MWNLFIDTHSLGEKKLRWEQIYIESALKDAKRVFKEKVGKDPDHCSCNCQYCIADYLLVPNQELPKKSDQILIIPQKKEKKKSIDKSK